MSDEACIRARHALQQLCGGETDDHNTIFLEVVTEQGRRTEPSDFNEVQEFITDTAESLAGSRPVKTSTQNVQCVPGTERPEPEFGRGFAAPDENRIHCFMKFDNDQLSVAHLNSIRQSIESQFEKRDVGIGRGLQTINVVDRTVVRRAVPEMVGPPVEDVELL